MRRTGQMPRNPVSADAARLSRRQTQVVRSAADLLVATSCLHKISHHTRMTEKAAGTHDSNGSNLLTCPGPHFRHSLPPKEWEFQGRRGTSPANLRPVECRTASA